MFLDIDPEAAALAVPDKLVKREVARAYSLLSAMVRVTRDKPGELIQKFKSQLLKIEVEKIEAYPYVIEEDEVNLPACDLVEDTEHPHLMWILQNPDNVNWVLFYLDHLVKRLGGTSDMVARICALVEKTPIRGHYTNDNEIITPPPYPGRKGTYRPDPIDSWRAELHYSSPTWKDGAPVWWNQELSDSLKKK